MQLYIIFPNFIKARLGKEVYLDKKIKGLTLIEVLVSIGIISLISFGLMTIILHMQRETKSINERLAAMDLQRLIGEVLKTDGACTFELTDPEIENHPSGKNPQVFDSTKKEATIGLSQIHLAPKISSPTVVKIAESLSPVANQMKVSAIEIKNIVGSDDNFLADLQIAIEPLKLVRPIPNLSFKIILKTDTASPANKKKIIGCLNAGEVNNKVSGLCGSSAGQIFESKPSTNLCSQGVQTTNPVEIGGNWAWRCSGINGGDFVDCSAVNSFGGWYTYHWGQGCGCIGAYYVKNTLTKDYKCPFGYVGTRYLKSVGSCGSGIGGCNLTCEIVCSLCPKGTCPNESAGDCTGRSAAPY